MVEVEVEELLLAPIDAVFAQLADHENHASFAGGVGAQRRIRLGAVLWEDILAFERPTLLEYRIVKMRPPIVRQVLGRQVLGRVSLTKSRDGTRMVWTSEFEVRIPAARAPCSSRCLPRSSTRRFERCCARWSAELL